MRISASLVVLAGCGAAAPAEIRPALLEWRVGGDALVETILPATYRGRPVWRVVHHDGDPTQTAYDMYDVDRATLLPLRSVSTQQGTLELTFDGDVVAIVKERDGKRTASQVRAHDPMPEGPGLQVLLASLPLRPGYRRSFTLVDRWTDDDAARVKATELAVVGSERIETPLGRIDTLLVRIAPRDGSFAIRAWVRAEPPRYAVRIEYVRGELHVTGEVTHLVVE